MNFDGYGAGKIRGKQPRRGFQQHTSIDITYSQSDRGEFPKPPLRWETIQTERSSPNILDEAAYRFR